MCYLRQLSVYWSFWYELLIHFCTSINVLCCCSVMQLCPTLCNPVNCSTPGLPVPHHLPKFAQVHVHCINDAVQLSHPLTPSSPSVPASRTFPTSHLFGLDDQNTGASASASVLPVNIQGWSPLWLTGLISLLSKGLSGVFSSTIVESINYLASDFFMVQLSQLYMTTGKTIALTIQTFVGRVKSLFFGTLSTFAITFLPRNKHLLT